jgi:hypothetical protein
MSCCRFLTSGKSLSFAMIALLVGFGCNSDGTVSPSAAAPTSAPADTSTVPTDSVPGAPDTTLTAPDSLLPPVDSSAGDSAAMDPLITAVGTQPGVPFGPYNMRASSMTTIYNGTQVGITAPYFLTELSLARSKGGRFVQKMAGKKDSDIKNADGTFSLTKWKALVNTFKGIDFNSYIADGTLIGHFLIDEPQNAAKWGGKPIPHATVEEMAKYSKGLWPNLHTFARVLPSWLAKAPFNWVYLDAGWVQYASRFGNPSTFIAAEVAAAKSKGLGVMTGMNALDGGNGSSGIRGWTNTKWAMSATEITNYGNALLSQSYVCGFLVWTYLDMGATYFARADIKTAMTALYTKAKGHTRTSCRQ